MADEDLKDAAPVVPKRTRGPNKKKNPGRKPRHVRAVKLDTPTADAFAQVASTSGADSGDLAKLQAEIKNLQSQLDGERVKRTAAEAAALLAAESQGMLMQRDIREIPSGKTRTLKRLDRYKVVGHKDDGREILAPVFKDVEVPTFFYKIDLPPCGGTDLKINGTPFYHGTTLELDLDTLRTVKDVVYRCWKHDADIHGSDENAYRPKKANVISARQYG